MATEERTILDNIADIANPEITTIIEFDTPSLFTMGGILLAVIVIAILTWAIARKATNA